MKTIKTILAVVLAAACCTEMAAQGFRREPMPEGSYSPVTNINRNGFPRVLSDGSVMFRVNAPQACSLTPRPSTVSSMSSSSAVANRTPASSTPVTS